MKHDPCGKCGKWCDTHSLWYCEEKDDGKLHRYDFVQPILITNWEIRN